MRKIIIAAVAAASLLASAADEGRSVELYLERTIPAVGGRITALAAGFEGASALYGTSEGSLVLVDLATGEEAVLFNAGGREITAVAASPGNLFAALAARGSSVWLIDVGQRAPRGELKDAKGRVGVLAFSADGRHLAAGGEKKEIAVWEIPSGQLSSKLKGHGGEVLAISFADGDRSLISAGRDKKMIVWDAASSKALRKYDLEAGTIEGAGIDVTSAAVSADRLFLAAAIEEHILKKGGQGMIFKYHLAFFDVSKGALLKILADNVRKIEDVALYPGNCFAAFDNSTLQESSIAMRNIESGNLDLVYPVSPACRMVEFSADGRWLAGASEKPGADGEAKLLVWKVDYEMPASGCFSGRIRLASESVPILKKGPPRIAAVLPFATGAGDGELGNAAGNFMESRLSGVPGLKLIERARVDDIVKELALQKSGLVDKGSAVKAGKLLGAALIITGNIDRAGADLVVSARVIDVATGGILGTRQVHCGQCGADDIFDAIDMLARTIAE
ncbi:MAG: hypothetical protein MUF59_02765 [Candidatus Krumholzibacteria bacterium]|jgi:TolB-like protein|nr:hypothetical protein [Candidatus Krumholzibacteria bacterium]